MPAARTRPASGGHPDPRSGSLRYGTGRTSGRSPPSYSPAALAARIAWSRSRRSACIQSRLERTAFPLGQPAPDAGRDPVAEGILQARLPHRARCAHLPRGPGRLAALGVEHVEVSAVARSLLPPPRGETRWGSQVAVPRQAGRHRAGAVTRARQAAAKAARSATSRPLAANSSANRRGYRRVVLRVPRHITVCGSVPAMASRRTVSRETPSRCASCAAVRKSAGVLNFDRNRRPRWRDERRGQGPG